jgi:hypothetical protein
LARDRAELRICWSRRIGPNSVHGSSGRAVSVHGKRLIFVDYCANCRCPI